MPIKENTTIKDISLGLISNEVIEAKLKDVQELYLASFVNIELYDYLIAFMEWEKKTESKEWVKVLNQSIEEQRQMKLATVKMIDNHAKNIRTLKNLLIK